MPSIPPVPVGPVVTGAAKSVTWLVAARKQHVELGRTIRGALRSSICRYDPFAPGVDELAADIEDAMWNDAATPPDRAGRIARARSWLRGIVPGLRKSKPHELDFPDWRSEMVEWVARAMVRGRIDLSAHTLRCRSFPCAESLAERFPDMLYLEVASPRLMAPFRKQLLDALQRGDESKAKISQAFGDAGFWRDGIYGVTAAATGLTIADVVGWLPEPRAFAAGMGIVAAGGVAQIVARLARLRRRDKTTYTQQLAREDVRDWIWQYLQTLTGLGMRTGNSQLLHEAINQRSRDRYASAEALRVRKDSSDSLRLRTGLRKLRPSVAAAPEPHVAKLLRDLEVAFEQAGQCDEDETLPILHQLIVALEVAPSTPLGTESYGTGEPIETADRQAAIESPSPDSTY